MSITFNTAEDKIIVTFDDDTTIEYTRLERDAYLTAFSDRAADLEAMGW